MNRTNRILIILLLIQIGALVIFAATRTVRSTSEATKVLEGLDAAQATKIEITGATGTSSGGEAPETIVLAKDSGKWSLPSAGGYPADETKVTELLKKLGKLEARGPVVTKAKYHAKLQVAADEFQRKLAVTAGGKTETFYLGSSTGGRTHLRRDGQDDVLPVDGIKTWDVGDRASQWIVRDFVKIDAAELWEIRLENGKGKVTLVKGDDGTWTAPGVKGNVDRSTLDDIVRKASTVPVEKPVGKGRLTEQGLEKPAATITLITGKAAEGGKRPTASATLTWWIGNKVDNDYFVAASNSEFVVRTASWSVQTLVDKGPKELTAAP